MSNKDENNYSLKETWEIKNFISRNEFRFCGGEPTQNLNIIDAINLLIKDKKYILIMTNGIWQDSFIEFIEHMDTSYIPKIRFLFNVLEPKFYTKNQRKRLKKVLSTINPLNTTIGFTIYKKHFEYQYIIDVAKEYGIFDIRWSISAPNLNSSEYELDNCFGYLANRVYDFLIKANKEGFTTTNDCGYIPPCFFSDNQLSDLIKISNKCLLNWNCTNSPVDIGMKSESWRCYGLYSVFNTSLKKFKNDIELEKYFNRRTKVLNNIYPFEKCKGCGYWLNSCGGGCYAIRSRNLLFQKSGVIFSPIDDDNEILKCIPVKADRVRIKEVQRNKSIFFGNSIIENVDENKLAFLEEIDGKKNVGDLIDLWESNFSSRKNAQKRIIEMCRLLFEKDIIEVKYDYEYKSK